MDSEFSQSLIYSFCCEYENDNEKRQNMCKVFVDLLLKIFRIIQIFK